MTYSRNARHRKIRAGLWLAKTNRSDGHAPFWAFEARRQAERDQAAIVRAEAAAAEKKARKAAQVLA